jgi:hypothetical protein
LSFDLTSALESLPTVPPELRDSEGRRDCFVADVVADLSQQLVTEKGWRIRDIRLLSGGERIRGLLEGLSLGTIDSNTIDLKRVELDAKIAGLLGKDAKEAVASDLGEKTLSELLDLGESRFVPETDSMPEAPRKKGRPKGSGNKPKLKTDLDKVKEMLK